MFRVALLAIVATFIAFNTDFYLRQEWYLLEPNIDPTGTRPSELEEQEFELSPSQVQDGIETVIHYRKYATTSCPSKGAVFYLHGNRGSMNQCEWEIEFLIKLGYNVWTMDYRGYGDSKGKISEMALKMDSMAVFEILTAEVGSEPIIVWGRSFGSGVAAYVAAASKDKPEMLVLETPYWSLVDATQHRCPIIPSALFRYELPIYQYLLSADCPIHLIHGTRDEKIAFNSSERLLDFCWSNSVHATGHPIMCGVHNLRDKRTLAEFEEIAASILR